MENLIYREFRGMWLKTMKRLFNYGQKTNPFVFFIIRDRLIFPYKIAVKISKIANYFQTKNKFDENSTWSTLKYQNKQIQVKKFEPLSKIGKLGSQKEDIWQPYCNNIHEFNKNCTKFAIVNSDLMFIHGNIVN
jgi:hypothetical protein